MSKYRYILAGRGGLLRGAIPENYRILSPSDQIVFAHSIADCLNAERIGAEGVIWNSDDFDQLEELSPDQSTYGWMLVSINIPIYFHLTNIEQLEKLKNIRIHGFYSEDIHLLKESQKKLEPLPSE